MSATSFSPFSPIKRPPSQQHATAANRMSQEWNRKSDEDFVNFSFDMSSLGATSFEKVTNL